MIQNECISYSVTESVSKGVLTFGGIIFFLDFWSGIVGMICVSVPKGTRGTYNS